MKLAVVNQSASTGGWKYISLLTEGLKEIAPDIEITFFADYTDKISSDLLKNLQHKGISVQKLKHKCLYAKEFSPKKYTKLKLINSVLNYIRQKRYEKRTNLAKLEKRLNQFDAVFFSWPFNISALNITAPLFFIPHDFSSSHFFGFHSGHLYNREWYQAQKKQFESFARKGTAIVSSQYIADEYKRMYPDIKQPAHVVYLSKFNTCTKVSAQKCHDVLKKHDIRHDYILYANNWALHKNMQEVIGAYYLVKQKYPDIKLIITGMNTDGIYCQSNTPYYLDHVEYDQPYDVKSLGLIPEEELTAIMQSAKMVINSSLCEAGSGSALDAWYLGTPVVMSDIPAFKQQAAFLKTKAVFFNPRNSDSIAEAIFKYLDNPQLAQKDAEISKQNLDAYGWDKVAEQYLNIFKQGQSKHDKNI